MGLRIFWPVRESSSLVMQPSSSARIASMLSTAAVSPAAHVQRDGLQLSYICKVSCLEIYQVNSSFAPAMLSEPDLHQGTTTLEVQSSPS